MSEMIEKMSSRAKDNANDVCIGSRCSCSPVMAVTVKNVNSRHSRNSSVKFSSDNHNHDNNNNNHQQQHMKHCCLRQVQEETEHHGSSDECRINYRQAMSKFTQVSRESIHLDCNSNDPVTVACDNDHFGHETCMQCDRIDDDEKCLLASHLLPTECPASGHSVSSASSLPLPNYQLSTHTSSGAFTCPLTARQIASLVRDKLIVIICEKPHLYDKNDVNHFVLSTDDHILSYCDRFTHIYRDICDQLIDKTVNMIRDTLIWRKESTLSSLSDVSFPIEFYSVGGLFLYTQDIKNNQVIIFRLAIYQKIPQLKEGMELFTTYQMFRAHNIAIANKLNGWSLIFDITNVTMAQYDLPQLLWLINTMLKYYPRTLKAVYVLNTPWIFKKIANFINRAFIPNEWKCVLKFVSNEELRQFITDDNLPDYLNGTCVKSYRDVPEGALPVETVAFDKYGMSEKDCLRIKEHFDKYLPPEMRVNR